MSVKVPRFRHVDGRGFVRKRLDRRLRVPVITGTVHGAFEDNWSCEAAALRSLPLRTWASR